MQALLLRNRAEQCNPQQITAPAAVPTVHAAAQSTEPAEEVTNGVQPDTDTIQDQSGDNVQDQVGDQLAPDSNGQTDREVAGQ
jgi:hypothetical protein